MGFESEWGELRRSLRLNLFKKKRWRELLHILESFPFWNRKKIEGFTKISHSTLSNLAQKETVTLNDTNARKIFRFLNRVFEENQHLEDEDEREHLLSLLQDFDSELETQQLIVNLLWLHQSQFAGIYAAESRGYYKKEDLKVSFQEGGYSKQTDPIEIVVEQSMQLQTQDSHSLPIGITPASILIKHNLEACGDASTDVDSSHQQIKAVAAIHQNSAACLAGYRDRIDLDEIIGKNGFKNCRIEALSENVMALEFHLMLREDIDDSDFYIKHIYCESTHDIPELEDYKSKVAVFHIQGRYFTDCALVPLGKAEFRTGYTIHEPYMLKMYGDKKLDDSDIVTITLQDFPSYASSDHNFYGDVIFTTQYVLENYLNEISGFVDATCKGWGYALENENEEEILQIVHKYVRLRFDENIERFMLNKSRELIKYRGRRIGEMKEDDWNYMCELIKTKLWNRIDIRCNDLQIQELYKDLYKSS